MKRNAVTAILNGILAVSVLVCAGFSIQYVFIARQLRSLTFQAASINNTRVGVQALLADCEQYSRTNPAVIPVVESAGFKMSRGAPPAAAK